MIENKKILIQGAGIGGTTLAYWLKKRGFSPKIVEKSPHQRSGGYKVDVRGCALEIAQKMDILPDLLKVNVNLSSSKFVCSDKKIINFDGDFLGHTSKGEIEVNRWDLSYILSKKISDVEIIYDDSITNIDGNIVHFEKMGKEEFDIIIGADGQYSGVRRLVFGEDENFLKKFNVQFCVFSIPNIFNLNFSEIVYFNSGKLVTAYAALENSYASFAFKSTKEHFPSTNLTEVFDKEFQNLGWQTPLLNSLMKKSKDIYFGSIAQVKMDSWSKGRVTLIGDAAHSVQGMGTSLAMIGAYVLAEQLELSNGNYSVAFDLYEKKMKKYVEECQLHAEKNLENFTKPQLSIKIQFYLMRILPKKLLQYFLDKDRKQMQKVANNFSLN